MNYGPDVVAMVIEEMGIDIVSEGGGWGQACCPLHEDSSPSFTIHLSEGGWKCYAGCGSSGDLAELIVADDETLELKDVQRRLRRRMPVDDTALLKALEDIDREEAETERRSAPLYYETGVAPKYMLDRGFTIATLKEWRIGWDSESGSVVIPATEDGEIVGLIRRKLNWNGRGPKYKNSDNFKPQERGHLFGLDHIPADVHWVIVVEGPMDAMWLWQCGLPAVALLGSALSDSQADALKRRFWRVVIATDADKAGRKIESDIKKALAALQLERLRIEPGKKDVQQSSEEYLKEAVSRLTPLSGIMDQR